MIIVTCDFHNGRQTVALSWNAIWGHSKRILISELKGNLELRKVTVNGKPTSILY